MSWIQKLLKVFKAIKLPEKRYFVCCPKCRKAFSPWFVDGRGLIYCYYGCGTTEENAIYIEEKKYERY